MTFHSDLGLTLTKHGWGGREARRPVSTSKITLLFSVSQAAFIKFFPKLRQTSSPRFQPPLLLCPEHCKELGPRKLWGLVHPRPLPLGLSPGPNQHLQPRVVNCELT